MDALASLKYVAFTLGLQLLTDSGESWFLGFFFFSISEDAQPC